MQVSRYTVFRVVIFIAAVAAFLAAPGFSGGEAKRVTRDTASIKPARAIPISNWLITVSISGGKTDGSFEVSQFEGGLIRIEKSQGVIYGFSPFISDRETGKVAIKVYRISQDKDANGDIEERLSEVQALVADKAVPTGYEDGEAIIKFQVRNIRQDSSLTGDILMTQGNLRLQEDCCIRCDGDKVCACRVASVCGGCCDGPCCHSSQTR